MESESGRIGQGVSQIIDMMGSGQDLQSPLQPELRKEIEVLDAYSRAVVSVVNTVGPAVVSIAIARKAAGAGAADEQAGAGSGFVIAPDGYVLTNSHVVSGMDSIDVVFTDGQHFRAELIGDDPPTDLALVRVNASGLPFLTLGDSAGLRVGQLVIAVGNPFGFQSTVSTGVISALGRGLRGRDGRLIENVIQHTSPLNPGNSGGPLLDSHARVVGINTAIVAMAQGIGFSVPSNTARWVISEILRNGSVRRGYLGIAGRTRGLGRRFVRYHGLAHGVAVEIVSVEKWGPAARAGIQSGDFIVAVNGQPVQSIDEIYHFLSQGPQELTLDIVRRTERLTVTLAPDLAETTSR